MLSALHHDSAPLCCRFGLKTCGPNSECYCSFALPIPLLDFCLLWDCAPSADPEL